MIDDFPRCYAAIASRDPRFDGWFYLGVTSTGIYCRPSCRARTPKTDNVRLFATAAAAHNGGFRACMRCRPDASPGSPAWDLRADLVARAMRLIAEGIVDRDGVQGLAAHLGYSTRHIHRQLVAEVGAGPIALARAQRAHTARVLIETTSLPLTHVAFAAGFASVRQFNDTVRSIFAMTPGELRRRASRRGHVGSGGTGMATGLSLRLVHRAPADMASVLRHLAERAVTGVESAADGRHLRSLALPHGSGIVDLMPKVDGVHAILRLEDLRDLTTAVQRCRRLLDLDADPVAVDELLGADPQLRPLVARRAGVRVPGSADPSETAVRIVLGQQVSVAAARTLASRLVVLAGTPLPQPVGALTHLFPTSAALAAADLEAIGMPASRRRALRGLVEVLAIGQLDLSVGADREESRRALAALPGIGPWTVESIALRALGDPDGFPASDLVLRRTAAAAGLPATDRGLTDRARAWRPWRAYAAEHLWGTAARPPADAKDAAEPAWPCPSQKEPS